MKLKSLLSTLAFLLFAGAASAQSDPSTGGSFGTSFDHNVVTGGQLSGTARVGQDASMTAPLPTQTKPSFWDRVTGRNRSSAQAKADKTGHTRAWFGPQGTNIRSRSWSKNHDNAQSNKRPVASKTKTTASTSSTRSSGWHLFGKR